MYIRVQLCILRSVMNFVNKKINEYYIYVINVYMVLPKPSVFNVYFVNANKARVLC